MNTQRHDDPMRQREADKYQHPVPSREYLIDFLSPLEAPISWPALLAELGIEKRIEKIGLKRRLNAMIRDGQLGIDEQNRYYVTDQLPLETGKITGCTEGYGLLSPLNGGENWLLPLREMRKVLPGDVVLVSKAGLDRKGRTLGVVRKIVQVSQEPIVGRYQMQGRLPIIEPLDHNIRVPITLTGETQKARVGQIVLVKCLTHPSTDTRLLAEIVEVLGDEHSLEVQAMIAMQMRHIPNQWPTDILKGVHRERLEPSNQPDYIDCTDLPFVTIDGEEAKDFDDAVYCQTDASRGEWQLWVAIADVSHYVQPGTPLDEEAARRGTSVYFPGKVVPMLPEILTNDWCSLKANCWRLTIVCEMQISAKGKLISSKFYHAIIRSRARLTYQEVAHWCLDTKEAPVRKSYWPSLAALKQLCQCMQQARLERGALSFEMIEPKAVFGAGNDLVDIVATERLISHEMIEEAMLLANIAAANFAQKHKLPVLYRNHPLPDRVKLQTLCQQLQIPGFKHAPSKITSQWVAELLQAVQAQPNGLYLQVMVLQTMGQASYSPICEGHFGLAYSSYVHFTSPIRRYPDLHLHQVLNCMLRHHALDKSWKARLPKLGLQCSIAERRAEEAERDVLNWLKCKYMVEHIGETYSAVVRTVVEFGLFVQLEDKFIEGLVHVTALKNDYYQFESNRHRLRGKRTGTTYSIGDKLQVRLLRVDLEQRRIDFALV